MLRPRRSTRGPRLDRERTCLVPRLHMDNTALGSALESETAGRAADAAAGSSEIAALQKDMESLQARPAPLPAHDKPRMHALYTVSHHTICMCSGVA